MNNTNIASQPLQETQDTLLPVGSPSTPYSTVVVTNIERGEGDTVATFNVRIGGILVRRASLRRGRNGSTFVNFPSFKTEQGRWVHLVEIVSPALDNFVAQKVHKAVSEVVR